MENQELSPQISVPKICPTQLQKHIHIEGETALDKLTSREKEVVALFVQGLSNKAIGENLLISTQTVENHTTNIFHKLKYSHNPEKKPRVEVAIAHINQNPGFKNPFDNFEIREPFSDRESEILDLAGQGLSNEAIGKKLFISERTVEHHTNNILKKIRIDHEEQNPRVVLMLVSKAKLKIPTNDTLTPREKEVIALIAQGLSNKAIGENLFVETTTVGTHTTGIFSKFKIDGSDIEKSARVEAASKYINQNPDFKNPFDGYEMYEAFTGREGEILALAGQGLSNKTIKELLNIKQRTVEHHTNNILKKIRIDHKEQNPRVVLMLVSKAKLKIPTK